jgi:murein DD-endopeptidase MepM/ murein hydrolase activator NlpD
MNNTRIFPRRKRGRKYRQLIFSAAGRIKKRDILIPAILILLGIGACAYLWPRPQEPTEGGAKAEDETIPGPAFLPLDYSTRVINKGDTLSEIAQDNGLRVDSLISCNGISNSRGIRYGDTLKIPNQDGIIYAAKAGDTIDTVAARFSLPIEQLKAVNHCETLFPGEALFLPGAKMGDEELRHINGDIFIMPARGAVAAPFGACDNPFTGVQRFHHGVDLAVPWGSPVRASMGGRVIAACRNDPSLGNYIVISHTGGYDTYYFHLSAMSVKSGQRVNQGQVIGRVGDTGAVTGTHLHFGISRNGVYCNPLKIVGKVISN